MSRNRSSVVFVGFAAMAAVACPLAAGCAAAESDDMVSEGSVDVPLTAMTGSGDPDDPPVGHNGDDPAGLVLADTLDALATMSENRLVTSAVDGNRHIKSFPSLSATSRQFLRSAVRCALKKGDDVVDPETNETYRGWWGLAPAWNDRALTTTEQRWVSACMIQKLNAFDATVMMLLQGNHPAIAYNENLARTYDFVEVTAFGNLFLGLTNIELFASPSDNFASTCGDPAAAIEKRICGTKPNCNVTILPTDAGHHVADHYLEFPGHGYTETITVRLRTASEDRGCVLLQTDIP